MHYVNTNKTYGEKAITQECCVPCWTSPGGHIQQNSSCTATYQLSLKLQIRRTKHTGHCRRNKDELISDVLLWTPAYGRAKVGRPARTYIQQLCADTGYSLEDFLGAMDDREGLRARVREICASSATWWWHEFLLF